MTAIATTARGRGTATEMALCVTSARAAAHGVLLLTLCDPAGNDLPEWAPGDHLEIVLPSGLIRHYSLCGDFEDLSSYTVAVLLVEDGGGGSKEIHDRGLVGEELIVRGPRNHFPLVEASAYLLIAGGIGVTPLYAIARYLQKVGAEWTMIYGGRTAEGMAFREELGAIGGTRVSVVPQDTHGIPNLATALEEAGPGTAVYCCGPDPMLRAVEGLVAGHADRLTLHTERFGKSGGPLPVAEGGAFELYLADSDITIQVPGDRSALDCIREVKPDHPYSCMEGTCGSCEVMVRVGAVDHRDEVLTEDEREENTSMMPCVSRGISPRIVIEL